MSAAKEAALPVVIVYNPHPVGMRTILVDEHGRVVRSPEVDAEIAALRARVAELEAALFPLPCGHPQYYIDDGSGRGGPRVDSCAWCALNDEVADGDRVAEKLHAVQEAARAFRAARGNLPLDDFGPRTTAVLSAALATITDDPGAPAPPPARVPIAITPEEAALCACACDPCRMGDHAAHDRGMGTARCPAGDAAEYRWRRGAGEVL